MVCVRQSIENRVIAKTLKRVVLLIVCASVQTGYAQRVRVDLQALDQTSLLPITEVAVNEPFVLRASVEHLDPETDGVFSIYMDVGYDENMVETIGEPTYGDAFPNVHGFVEFLPGKVNDIGGVGSVTPPIGASRQPLFDLPVRAMKPGPIDFEIFDPENAPLTDIGLYGSDVPVAWADVELVNARINAVPEPTGAFVYAALPLLYWLRRRV